MPTVKVFELWLLKNHQIVIPLPFFKLDGVFTLSLFLLVLEVAVEDSSNYKHRKMEQINK
jgi:hypothetical protein